MKPNRLKLENRFMELTTRIAHSYRSELNERLRLCGSGAGRLEVMATLARAEQPMTQNEIAHLMGILNSTLTRLIVALEQEGLILRVRDPSNLRSKLVELTPKGRERCDELLAVALEFRSIALRGHSKTEFADASQILAGLLSALRA